MIAQLEGLLIEKSAPWVVIDCHGVGYECEVTSSTFANLPAVGVKTRLLTHFVVREDAQLLYGFADETERATFRQLLKISGIGAKSALGILSAVNISELARAVALQDAGLLTRIPGIGKKTAERLVLELKGKLDATMPTLSAHAPTMADEALQALLALGYQERVAKNALQHLPADLSLEERTKQALAHLSRQGN